MENLKQERSEKVLLCVILLISVYMIVGAQQWGFETSIFPQFTAGATLVGALLLLFRKFLPQPIQKFAVSSVQIFDESEETVDEELDQSHKKTRESTNRPLKPTQFTGVLIAAYVAIGTLFGVWWVTPIFIIVYGVWFQVPWIIIGTLIIFSIVLIYVFNFIFQVPIDEGILIPAVMVIV